ALHIVMLHASHPFTRRRANRFRESELPLEKSRVGFVIRHRRKRVNQNRRIAANGEEGASLRAAVVQWYAALFCCGAVVGPCEVKGVPGRAGGMGVGDRLHPSHASAATRG